MRISTRLNNSGAFNKRTNGFSEYSLPFENNTQTLFTEMWKLHFMFAYQSGESVYRGRTKTIHGKPNLTTKIQDILIKSPSY